MAYASTTSVSVERSRLEIERLCHRHKCDQFGSAINYITGTARVQFRAQNRIIRFELSLPKSEEFRQTAKWEQACRSRWRALVLVLKAKLESVENEIASFEEEFMPYIVMPNDQTLGAIMTPLIADAYSSGKMPKLLGSGS